MNSNNQEELKKMIQEICTQTINQCKNCTEHPEQPKKRERKQREKKIRSESQVNRDKERMSKLREIRIAKKTNNTTQ